MATGGSALCRHPVANRCSGRALLDPVTHHAVRRSAAASRRRFASAHGRNAAHRDARHRTEAPPRPAADPAVDLQRQHARPDDRGASWPAIRVSSGRTRLPHAPFPADRPQPLRRGNRKPEVRSHRARARRRVPRPTAMAFPQTGMCPASRACSTIRNAQDAATLWYHDHAMGINRLNMYAGLIGAYLLRDAHETVPGSARRRTGDSPAPVPIACSPPMGSCTTRSRATGTRRGWRRYSATSSLVNGAVLPHPEVQPRRYRLRVINAANGRFFHLRLAGHRPFQQIGTDQGLLAAPAKQTSLLLAPGERADLVVDFAALRGQSTGTVERCAAHDAIPGRQGPRARHQPVPPVLRERATHGRGRCVEVAPAHPRRIRRLRRRADADAAGRQALARPGHRDDPTLGSTEIWSLLNLTEDTHPIHLHLVRFQILDRRPFDIDA